DGGVARDAACGGLTGLSLDDDARERARPRLLRANGLQAPRRAAPAARHADAVGRTSPHAVHGARRLRRAGGIPRRGGGQATSAAIAVVRISRAAAERDAGRASAPSSRSGTSSSLPRRTARAR